MPAGGKDSTAAPLLRCPLQSRPVRPSAPPRHSLPPYGCAGARAGRLRTRTRQRADQQHAAGEAGSGRGAAAARVGAAARGAVPGCARREALLSQPSPNMVRRAAALCCWPHPVPALTRGPRAGSQARPLPDRRPAAGCAAAAAGLRALEELVAAPQRHLLWYADARPPRTACRGQLVLLRASPSCCSLFGASRRVAGLSG